jgi:hypothetical protein
MVDIVSLALGAINPLFCGLSDHPYGIPWGGNREMGEPSLGPVPYGHPTSLSPHMWKEIDEVVGGYMAEIKAVGHPSI